MARKARWAGPPALSGGSEDLITADTPPEVVRQMFGRRLWRLLVEKGWNQSELSRRAGIARDSVSTYVRGLAMPDPVNAGKIAQAFGMELHELNPVVQQVAAAESMPSVELKQSVGGSGRVWLRINKEVSFEVGVKILALLEAS